MDEVKKKTGIASVKCRFFYFVDCFCKMKKVVAERWLSLSLKKNLVVRQLEQQKVIWI